MDERMTVRAWARSRLIPASTAQKAAESGRISRDAQGKVDPATADREWVENTRPRIDGRKPQPPGGLDPELEAHVAELEASMRTMSPSDPNEWPRGWVPLHQIMEFVRDQDSYFFVALYQVIERTAPELVGKTEAEIRQRLLEVIIEARDVATFAMDMRSEQFGAIRRKAV